MKRPEEVKRSLQKERNIRDIKSKFIRNIDVKQLLSDNGWPVNYQFNRTELEKKCIRNGFKPFQMWFDFLKEFNGLEFELHGMDFSFDATREIDYPDPSLDKDIAEMIGQNHMFLGGEPERSWIMAEDGAIFMIYADLLFYGGESLDEAFRRELYNGFNSPKVGIIQSNYISPEETVAIKAKLREKDGY